MPWWPRRAWALGVLLAAVLAGLVHRRVTGPPALGDDFERYHRHTFRVVKVVDGDTLDVNAPDGRRESTRIRLWGVDTPEVAGSGREAMYYGPEASACAKAALNGKDVMTLLVQGKTRDRYGRLLAYLMLPNDDRTFNERLVETGHAYADPRFGHPLKDRFLAVERQARRKKAGLWGNVRPDQMPRWRQKSGREMSE